MLHEPRLSPSQVVLESCSLWLLARPTCSSNPKLEVHPRFMPTLDSHCTRPDLVKLEAQQARICSLVGLNQHGPQGADQGASLSHTTTNHTTTTSFLHPLFSSLTTVTLYTYLPRSIPSFRSNFDTNSGPSKSQPSTPTSNITNPRISNYIRNADHILRPFPRPLRTHCFCCTSCLSSPRRQYRRCTW